jgi:hypothetical protein
VQQMSGSWVHEVEFGDILKPSLTWRGRSGVLKLSDSIRLVSLGGLRAVCVRGAPSGWTVGKATELLIVEAWEVDDAWPTTR